MTLRSEYLSTVIKAYEPLSCRQALAEIGKTKIDRDRQIDLVHDLEVEAARVKCEEQHTENDKQHAQAARLLQAIFDPDDLLHDFAVEYVERQVEIKDYLSEMADAGPLPWD